VQVHLDVSVFSSPSVAYGYARGEIEVANLPEEGSAFPWPPAWVEARPSLFSPEQSLVVSVRKNDQGFWVQLCGVVCWSHAEAEDCALYLEQHGKLFFDRYSNGAEENGA
jgi:hypothetical protein